MIGGAGSKVLFVEHATDGEVGRCGDRQWFGRNRTAINPQPLRSRFDKGFIHRFNCLSKPKLAFSPSLIQHNSTLKAKLCILSSHKFETSYPNANLLHTRNT